MKKTLVLQDGIYAEIVRPADEFKGLELAITLFGSIRDERFEVTHFAPPGSASEHAHGRCTNDHEFESDVFNRLRKEYPASSTWGICTRTPRPIPGSPEQTTRRSGGPQKRPALYIGFAGSRRCWND